ncbi:MAG: exopolysaccharide biosynthesis protein VpsJ [Calditrichia bacterium]
MPTDIEFIDSLILGLENYVVENNFKGWDVFDGLNSKILQALPFFNYPLIRLAWIQLFKRSPINLRKLLYVEKGANPKAHALFILAYLNKYAYTGNLNYLRQAENLHRELIEFSNKDYGGLGFGYNFPWQARAFYVPKFKPNMIVSIFAGLASLELYKYSHSIKYLDISDKICQFILKNLVLFENETTACFAYIPGEKAVVHNVNMLGAAYCAISGHFLSNSYYKKLSKKFMNYSVLSQRPDGAWVYGERNHHQFVDNFHTGYNLTALALYRKYTSDFGFDNALIKGLKYHLKNHFLEDGTPKYTDKRIYPIDIHCYSQLYITKYFIGSFFNDDNSLLLKSTKSLLQNLYDKKRKYFYYQKYRHFTIKIPYIRWAQAWMFYSLTTYRKMISE